MRQQTTDLRLDASEQATFRDELTAIDKRVFDEVTPGLMARQLIQTVSDIAEGDEQYKYRMFKSLGRAKFAAKGNIKDAPQADVSGREFSTLIKPIIMGFHYDIWEIKAAAKHGRHLDAMRAINCKQAVEQLVDEVLAWGSADEGLKGLLTLDPTDDGVNDFTGSGTWGPITSADPEKVYNDLVGIAAKAHTASHGIFSKFRILLPIGQFTVASTVRLADAQGTTSLKAALANSPFIESIVPWLRCSKDADGSPLAKDVMLAYPPGDERVVGALIGSEYQTMPPEPNGYQFDVNAHASCGGVVARYPIAITTCDDTGV